jgi:hypothetical protein
VSSLLAVSAVPPLCLHEDKAKDASKIT